MAKEPKAAELLRRQAEAADTSEKQKIQNGEPNYEPRPTKRTHRKIETSKMVLALVMVAFFGGVILGAIVVWNNPTELSGWLIFIGGPTSVAIGVYAWKAKAENVLKYKNDGVNVDDVSNL